MPPVTTPQGSRSGLISGLVASIIIGLVFAVFYFQERGLRQKAENEVKAGDARLEGLLPGGDLPERVKAAREASLNQGGTEQGPKQPLVVAHNAFELIDGERAALVKLETGSSTETARNANDFALANLADAKARVGASPVKPDGVNFSQPPSVVARQLADAYFRLATDKAAADKAVADAQAQVAAANKARDDALATSNAEIKKTQDQLSGAQNGIAALQQSNAAGLEQVTKSNVGNLESYQQQVAERDAQLAKLNAQLPALQKDLDNAKRALKSFRMDPTDNTVRQPDGTITQISEDRQTCIIDIGQADHVVQGMTFEVYDRVKGIPSLKADVAGYDDEDVKRSKAAIAKVSAASGLVVGGSRGADRYDAQLPEGGKGSIEVIQVRPGHTAVCRIIKTATQGGLREGDVIANLVYDKNVKFKFVVFGQFDLDYNGIPTLSDTATVRRLVEEWGGKLMPATTPEDVTADVDFIVMGVAPVIPTATPGDENNPVFADQVAKAQAAKQQYDAVLQRARELTIPVLNQTRFLYYTGYFDQKTR